MKRAPDMTDEQWAAKVLDRQSIARKRMNVPPPMFTQKQVMAAARHWYGKTDLDSACLAENRLMRGETP